MPGIGPAASFFDLPNSYTLQWVDGLAYHHIKLETVRCIFHEKSRPFILTYGILGLSSLVDIYVYIDLIIGYGFNSK